MLKKTRILIVTPEVTYLPEKMENKIIYSAKAGGLADVSAALISSLFFLGADVHVALPYYRSLCKTINNKDCDIKTIMNKFDRNIERIHLASDRSFYYMKSVYSGYSDQDIKVSLAFQREVINNIIPRVKPDIIHCNDWMTGLIPAMAKRIGIPCLFTIHNIYTMLCTMSEIENNGIDAASFWQYFFFKKSPNDYEKDRNWNQVDFLTSGIFSSHYVNTVSPQFLKEIIKDKHQFIDYNLIKELKNKYHVGCATGILNAPEADFNPKIDKKIYCNYGPKNHKIKKTKNKLYLQEVLGLQKDENAPLFFWPSRLDPVQKGCQILSDILYDIVSKYWTDGLQIIFVADGVFEKHFHDIVDFHGLKRRVCVCGFNETLSHQAFASSDFLFMPSLFEPCGLPQMIGCIYGTLPIVFDTGGLHDTIVQLDINAGKGNGFLFDVHDSNGLRWAVDMAMEFYHLAPKVKNKNIVRIMTESVIEFNYSRCAESYIDLYKKILKRPFII